MNLNPRITNTYLLLAGALLCYLLAFIINHNVSRDSRRIIHSFEKVLHQKEARVEEELDFLSAPGDSVLYSDIHRRYTGWYEKEGILFLIYKNDSLLLWTDHTVAFDNVLPREMKGKKAARLKNGWFEVMSKRSGEYVFLGLILIRNEYPIENKYLSKSFHDDFRPGESIEISFDKAPAGHVIADRHGNYLFSFILDNARDPNVYYLVIRILLMIAGSVFLILFFKKTADRIGVRTKGYVSVLFFISTALVIRFFSILYGFPAVFYELELFHPQLYGDANFIWLSSLGDVFVNMLIVAYLSYYWNRRNSGLNGFSFSIPVNYIASILTCLLLYVVSLFVNQFIIGLVYNSNISFNTNNLFNLDVYSYIAFVTVGLAILSFYFITDKAAAFVRRLNLPAFHLAGAFLIAIALIAIISHLRDELDESLFLWSSALLAAVYVIKYHSNFKNQLTSAAVYILIISFYSAHIFTKFSNSKENNYRQVLAEKLSSEQDPVAEFLFSEAAIKMQGDTLLKRSILSGEAVSKLLLDRYFGGYWKKYDIQVSIDELFLQQSVSGRIKPFSHHFSYTGDPSGKIRLTGVIPLRMNDRLTYINMEFDSKLFSERVGFPELLISRENKLYEGLKEYSFAKYKNNQLASFYGSYSYPLVNDRFDSILPPNSLFFDGKKNNHLLYKQNKDSFVIVSKPKVSFFDQVTTFSFLFSFYSLTVVSLLFCSQLINRKLRWRTGSLKNKIQFLLVSLVFTSLVITGLITVMYIKAQFEKGARRNAQEKIYETLKDIRKSIDVENAEAVENTLRNTASVFSNDIILYDARGDYVASSIHKLFEYGLLSKKMCPEAYYELHKENESETIHNERIGNLSYLSAYIPFKNDDGKLLGYMNMPYFSKQDDLQKEISSFSGAIINIYVFLFVLSVLTAILISNIVTSPLRIIQEKIGAVRLGKKNELIRWNKNDEIGSLIEEYNRMVAELMRSAELLARSERESAWREMAKQVAHEIKNPLTPMKLSIQHFDKTWNKDMPGNDEKIRRFTQSLIEQIEALSSIADEFSNFAKMPKALSERVDIKQMLLNVVGLYRNASSPAIDFVDKVDPGAFVFCDRDQLLRVLNNLIKNAIQAIPEDKTGEIEVILKRKMNSFIIEVKDNGTGISVEQREKIFVPNFTTRTGGAGLGLAMTKNIVEGFGGKIWFGTEEGRGTSFFIELPVYEE